MRQVLVATLDKLLDETGCLGVGLVDGHGLLLQSSGAHGGVSVHLLAPNLLPFQVPHLDGAAGDSFEEFILVGDRYTFVVRLLLAGRMLLYGMLPPDAAAGPIRYRLGCAALELERLISGPELLLAVRQRLEQPQKFPGGYLTR